ncbi:MAG: tRNA pseudouridine(55) synthase TruB [Mariniblastus sp.]|nr:tRNA pseudouridine(55) synthase TruB [Mariniblastus sp.]
MFGFLNINKPRGETSRTVVNSVQKLVRPFKVGHAGTLDPLATGVLVVCVGPATRLTQFVQRMPKTYLGTFRLGVESDTEDLEGQVIPVEGAEPVDRSQLESVLKEFVGQIQQLPPRYSALKVNGRRAYKLARAGADFELNPRTITIESISLVDFTYPEFKIELECSSGTYVRSLGRDIGRRLGSGAIMTNLTRTAIGNFSITDSISPIGIGVESIRENLVAAQDRLDDLSYIAVPNTQLELFANGYTWEPKSPLTDGQVGAVDESGRLLAILNRKAPDCYTPKINFSKYWLEQTQRGLGL